MYVIYNKDSTLIMRIWRRGWWQGAKYETESAAKAGLTRLVNRGAIAREDYLIAESADFHANIELQETRRNLMTGTEFSQPVNTPIGCDPSMETYWSM